MSNPQKASLSGTKETHLWGDTLCVMELTVQQAARGKPQTWASSPLLLRGSSSQSSLAGPHTSLSPTVGCYSGWWSGLPFHWPGSLPLQDESMLEWQKHVYTQSNSWSLCTLFTRPRFACIMLSHQLHPTVDMIQWLWWRSCLPDATSKGPCAFLSSLTPSRNSRPPAFSRALPERAAQQPLSMRTHERNQKRYMNRCCLPTPSLRSSSALVGLIIPSTLIVPILLISLSVNESCGFTKTEWQTAFSSNTTCCDFQLGF